MQLYDGGRAPNPRRVRIFLAEKQISVPLVPVDLAKGEHKSEAFTRINPSQRVPVLVLDDGTAIAETMAICRYFEALQPAPSLFGASPREIALIEMWQRRIELELFFPLTFILRHTNPGMAASEVPQVPAWGEANRPRALAFLEYLDGVLADRAFIAGENYSVADIPALVAVDFMGVTRLELAPRLSHVRRWHDVVSARPSAKA